MQLDTVALLTELAQRAEDLAGTLPSLDLGAAELAEVASDMQRINARLARIEERLAALGPVEDVAEAVLS